MTLPQLVAAALNIPSWAPKAVKRATVCAVVAVAIAAPSAYNEGVQIAIQVQRERIEKMMAPVIEQLLTPVEVPPQPHVASEHQ